MTSQEKILGRSSLGIAIAGAAWGLLVLFAEGMSNVADQARRDTPIALPPAVLAFALSALTLILAYRRHTIRTCAWTAIPAFVISVGTILLVIAALMSYR